MYGLSLLDQNDCVRSLAGSKVLLGPETTIFIVYLKQPHPGRCGRYSALLTMVVVKSRRVDVEYEVDN